MPYNSNNITEESFYKYVIGTKKFCTDKGIVYVYKDSTGHYVRTDDTLLRQTLMKLIPKDKRASVKSSLIDNIVRKLKIDPDLHIDMGTASDANNNYLNVANGVIDLTSGNIQKHDPKKHFTYFLNFSYNSNADITKCEAFMKFARSSLGYDTDIGKTTRLLEIMGYTISSVSGAEKCFILVGASNSGKSVMLNLVEKVVGDTNTTNIPINKLGEKFNLGELSYSRVNINREISGSELKDMDIFKSICSCERITGELKYVNSFSYKCRCKMLFAGNCLPEIKKVDSSNNEAIFNRLCILYFSKGLTDEEKDLTLEERLFNERDVIFSAAINALMELRKRHFIFTEDAESTKYLDNYKSSNQALKHFIEECCIIDLNAKIHTRDFISAFKKYCADNALDYCYSNESINAYVMSICGVCRKKFRLSGSVPLNGFIGLGLKSYNSCNDMEQD